MIGGKKGCQHKEEDITEQLAAGLESSVFSDVYYAKLFCCFLIFWLNFKCIDEAIVFF